MKSNIVKRIVASVSVAGALAAGYLIAPWEGKRNEVYLDVVGIPTVCYGQTGKDLYGREIKLGMSYTDEECELMLVEHIKKIEKQIDNRVLVPYVSDYQKASLVSFVYNVGIGAFERSTLLKKLNTGQHEAACEELMKWVYAGGKRLQGLANRREQEKQYCLGNVPQDVKVTYDEIIFEQIKENHNSDFRDVSEESRMPKTDTEEAIQQEANNPKSSSQSTYRCFFGWFECVRRDWE